MGGEERGELGLVCKKIIKKILSKTTKREGWEGTKSEWTILLAPKDQMIKMSFYPSTQD